LSIRTRLILLVLAALAPALGAALWVVNETYSSEREGLERNLRDNTHSLAMLVDREFGRREAIARELALSRALDNAPQLSPEDLQRFEQQARHATADLQGWVVLSSPQGELLNTWRPAADAPQASLAGAGATPASAALSDRPSLTPLAAGTAGRPQRAALVQPVQRNGKTSLNVALTVLPSELQRICDDQRLPDGWITAVLDSQGHLVARNPGGAQHLGRSASPELLARLGTGSEGFLESVAIDGVPMIAFFSTSPFGWSYVMAVPRSEFGSSLQRAVLQVALAGLAVLGLGVAAALWVSRDISGPMTALARAARRLQRGEPVAQEVTGLRECDQVSAALAEASGSILHGRAELESQVAAAVSKTRDVEQRASHSRRIEALGRLTGGVAHDFNNLLGIISNSAHLMRRLPPGGDTAAPLGAVLRAVETGSRLTQHLLRFSGRQAVRPEKLLLQQHLPDVQPLLKTVVGSAIQLEVETAPETWPVMVDAGELELALINLALNARDAMPGGGRLLVRARNAQEYEAGRLGMGEAVVISVTDSGAGFAPQELSHAFEPFFTTKPAGKGSGLGLSQVMGFCKQAGGTAQLNSAPGQGTTVLLWLPRDSSVEALPLPASAAPPAGQSIAGARLHQRLLLVEDNEPLGKVTEALLTSFGYEVMRVASGEQALDLLASQHAAVDLALSDVVMPGGMDGFTLARRLHALYPRLPVVLISGYTPAPALAQDFEVLRKPCPPDELIAALKRAAGQMAPA
jgi:signal transduction histidine kinase/ActR/RegA family two-component response regulator